MNTIVTVEIVSAVFLAILLLTHLDDRTRSRSRSLLNLSIILVLATLAVDAAAYIFMDGSTPFAFRYAVYLLAYLGEGICFFCFSYYSETLCMEKMQISPWIFRGLRIAETVWGAGVVFAYTGGRMVVFEDGVQVADNGYPDYLLILQIAIHLFTMATAFRYRKRLGVDTVIMLSTFNLAPIAGILAAAFAYYDYSYVLDAVALVFIFEFLQRRETLDQQAEDREREIRSRNNSRIMALEDDFESLYDVNLDTGKYEVFIKGQTYGDITSKIVYLDDFFADTIKNVELVVYPEDREKVTGVLDPEYIRDALSRENSFDTYYRLMANDSPIWVKMRIIYKDETQRNIIVGVFNAEDEMRLISSKENELKHAEFRAAALSRLVENEEDVTSFLDFFAERLRELMGCDQVIYRDENGNRFIKNAPELGDGYEISPETCLCCPHSDMHSPLYRTGVTEMEDTAVGVDGVPVHRDCPVKSALTRTVFLDGEVKGYLAVHYILGYHRFTDDERQTLETVTNLLSESLSKYAAKQRSRAFDELKQRMNMVYSLSDEFDPIMVLDPATGKYDWYEGKAHEIDELTSMSTHGTDYYKDIAADAVSIVHEEDRERLVSVFNKENMMRIAETGEMQELETRWQVGPDDKYLWKYNKIVRMTDEKGKAYVVLGVTDTTEKKEKEAILEKQQKEAKDTVNILESVAGVYRFAFAFDMAGSYFKVIRMDDVVKYNLNISSVGTFEEAKSLLLGLLHPDDVGRMTHELDCDTIREKLRDAPSYSVEYRVLHGNATEWHEMKVTHIARDEVAMGFGEKDFEITRRHIDNIRFKKFFGLYEADLDTGMLKVDIDSPYYTFSETGDPVPYTPAMEKFADSQVGETREAFHKLADVGWVRDALAKDDTFSVIYHSVTAANTWVDVSCYVTKRHDDGTPSMFVLGYSFVSSTEAARQEMEQKIAEQNVLLEEQQEKLSDALEMAEVANRAKTDFLFNMSHDIRTPMNAIIGFTNMAKKEINNPEKSKAYLEKVQLSSDILLNLINDVLDMSRIESGKVELHEERCDFEHVFDSFEPAMAGLADSRDIDLTFSLGEIRDRYIHADGPRFDRVLINIISNAIKYTLPGGFVKVYAEQTEDTKPGYGNYRLTVADSGIGMSEEFQKHMFENFSREENSTTRGIQGTGLGLSLAKRLVDLMGGTISCVSNQGIGTTFTMEFPFRLQTEDEISEEYETASEIGDVDLSGKKALLVEDNEMNREIAGDILTDEGIILETAENGQKAVNKVRERGADYYDFILMDIQMPVMNGYEATKMIRKLVPDLRAPIIALSANAFAEDKKKSLEAGMDDHVAKPIDIKELLGVLARFM